MNKKLFTSAQSLLKSGGARVALGAMLALPMLAAVPAAPATTRAHATLLELAARQPDARVSVIVQKSARSNDAEATVARLGGEVQRDLHIINAFSAELPARNVAELARSSSVRWVSPDAPVEDSSTTTTTYTTWATERGAAANTQKTDRFNGTSMAPGTYLWATLAIKATGLGAAPVTVNMTNASAQTVILGQSMTFVVPDGKVVFDPAATVATTSWNSETDSWTTTVPSRITDKVFMTGMAIPLPSGLPGGLNVTAAARFSTNTPGVSVDWKWAAAVYSNLSNDLNALGVKPCEDAAACRYNNTDKVGTPENYKPYLRPGARGNGGTNYTGDATGLLSTGSLVSFSSEENLTDSGLGPNGTYARGGKSKASFSGFSGEKTPSHAITRVELVLHGYVLDELEENARVTVSVGGQTSSAIDLDGELFEDREGISHAGPVYVNITGARQWQWGDFSNNLELTLDQTSFESGDYTYLDAVALRVTSRDGNDSSGVGLPPAPPAAATNTGSLENVYNRAVRATDVWNAAPKYLQGQGMTVAVIDSGIFKTKDVGKRVIGSMSFDDSAHTASDEYGHGTFVGGVIAGDGKQSHGKYIGIAPKANLLNLRVADENDSTTESVVVEALQWVLENKAQYNIRVVNLSLNSTVLQSYQTSPLAAACEIVWFNGVVVVVAAGNNGTANLYAPANDPFVITVGAVDDVQTLSRTDDTVATFSAFGMDETGGMKPDLVAPGRKIIAPLPDNDRLTLTQDHPEFRVDSQHFRLSGTSVAAPMVTGAVALLLQDEPNLNPDQVKYRLKATAAKTTGWLGYDPIKAGAGYLDIYAAVNGTSTERANIGLPVSALLETGSEPINWGTVNWGTVNWGTVNWGTVNWGTVNWGTVNWGTVNWDQ